MTPTPAAITQSLAWGTVTQIAQAEQFNPPGLLTDPLRLSWLAIDPDANRLRHHIRTINDTTSAAPVIVPFNTTRPDQQRLAHGANGRTHILWLDDNGTGQTRLFSATLTANHQLERGAIELSDRRAESYSFVNTDAGALWVVWSGGFASEPALYLQFVDNLGRPRIPQHLHANGRWPVLIAAADETHHLLWLDATNGDLYRARLEDETLSAVTRLTSGPDQRPGDRLVDFRVGSDEAGYAYAFWNIVKAGGTPQTWISSGRLDADTWDEPQGLFIAEPTSAGIETGFDTPNPLRITTGLRSAYHAAPLSTAGNTLPVAVQVDDRLALLYFMAGELVAFEEVAALQADLLRPPAITSDTAGHLYLSWSEPRPDAPADLYTVSSDGE